jgi:hypothetical protein
MGIGPETLTVRAGLEALTARIRPETLAAEMTQTNVESGVITPVSLSINSID